LSPKNKPTDVGRNRTGLASSPIDARAMLENSSVSVPSGRNAREIFNLRLADSRDAEPVGTMPPPPTLKGIAKAALEKLRGNEPMVFLDKLGERLAYERTGVRLYEALLVKFEASRSQDPTITSQALMEIRADELAHAGLLRDAIELLGGDPTVMTPCASISAVASMGFMQALTDPRTTFTQALGVVLTVELNDSAAWELLIDLANGLGLDDLTQDFREALAEEQRHLERIKAWHISAVSAQAGVEEELQPSPIV